MKMAVRLEEFFIVHKRDNYKSPVLREKEAD